MIIRKEPVKEKCVMCGKAANVVFHLPVGPSMPFCRDCVQSIKSAISEEDIKNAILVYNKYVKPLILRYKRGEDK